MLKIRSSEPKRCRGLGESTTRKPPRPRACPERTPTGNASSALSETRDPSISRDAARRSAAEPEQVYMGDGFIDALAPAMVRVLVTQPNPRSAIALFASPAQASLHRVTGSALRRANVCSIGDAIVFGMALSCFAHRACPGGRGVRRGSARAMDELTSTRVERVVPSCAEGALSQLHNSARRRSEGFLCGRSATIVPPHRIPPLCCSESTPCVEARSRRVRRSKSLQDGCLARLESAQWPWSSGLREQISSTTKPRGESA
jgi:hypothetical protein